MCHLVSCGDVYVFFLPSRASCKALFGMARSPYKALRFDVKAEQVRCDILCLDGSRPLKYLLSLINRGILAVSIFYCSEPSLPRDKDGMCLWCGSCMPAHHHKRAHAHSVFTHIRRSLKRNNSVSERAPFFVKSTLRGDLVVSSPPHLH